MLKTKLGISPNSIEEIKFACLSEFKVKTNNARLECSQQKILRLWLMVTGENGRDLNSVIMDYLISEGYPSAAQKFALEANIQLKVDVNSIRERVDIRNAIYAGNIQSAIEKINELDPEVSRQAFYPILESRGIDRDFLYCYD